MVAAGAAGLVVLPIVLLWERLPEPIAIHWSLSGTPDGSMSKLGFIAFSCALLALFAFVSSRKPAAGEFNHTGALVVAAVGGTLMPAVAVLSAVHNLDRGDWTQAATFNWSSFVLSLLPSVFALVAGFGARTLMNRRSSDDGSGSAGSSSDAPPSNRAESTERA
jgi:hypothetical protein